MMIVAIPVGIVGMRNCFWEEKRRREDADDGTGALTLKIFWTEVPIGCQHDWKDQTECPTLHRLDIRKEHCKRRN